MVVTGAQQAVDLIARVVLRPGDHVAVEEPGYHPIRRLLDALGMRVVPVPVDRELRMRPEALDTALRDCHRRHEMPMAVVATAGTTDTGAVDPLRPCAALAREHGAWLHVDAVQAAGMASQDHRGRPSRDETAQHHDPSAR